MLKKSLHLTYIHTLLLLSLFLSCAESEHKIKQHFFIDNPEISSGEILKISSHKEIDANKGYTIKLVNSNKEIVESYFPVVYNNFFIVNRFLNYSINSLENYSILIEADELSQEIPIQILPSVIIESFCGENNCNTLSGNVLEGTSNTITVNSFKIRPVKFVYTITTPYQTIKKENEYNTPTSKDWISGISFQAIPKDISFYIAKIDISVYDVEGEHVETSLPFKVVRPIEIKHFGKHELAQTYEPVPVTGCIPGAIGSNVQYSESTSETRQNSVSISINKSWSDSFSNGTSQNISEGISIQETQGTVNASSLSESETQSESYTNSSTQGESSNISFNTSDGESWSWSLGETESQTEGSSNSENTNTSINGSTTVGVSGEGSLPFIAKASGKVEVSAGIQRGWGETNTNSSSETTGKNRGYSTSGNSSSGKVFGSAQNDSRSHSLSGAYVLSSTTSSSISESSSLSSGRVWNMSEAVSSGKVVTEGNSENIAQTIVTSNSSSTTFSYSGYIPRGRFGVFYRQTSRYVKISEIISYDLNGIPMHSGYIMMNSWAWAPELSIGESCASALESHLPEALCIIPPCE